MTHTVRLIGIVTLLVLSLPALATDVQVVGLFPGKAVVRIDGERVVLSEGETSDHGVKLISANSEEAVFEIDGVTKSYALGTHIGTNYSERGPGRQHTIYSNGMDMYETAGFINGVSVNFLVDTGATTIAMNSGHARRIGVRYKNGRQIGVATASGVTSGYQVKLDRVRVGEIELTNVDAIVLEGDAPHEILLGMSFLSRLHVSKEGNKMVLERKY